MSKTLERLIPTDQLYEMIKDRISIDGRPVDPTSFVTFLRIGAEYWASRIDPSRNYVDYPNAQASRYRAAYFGGRQEELDFCSDQAGIYYDGAIRAIANGNSSSYLFSINAHSNWLRQRDYLKTAI